MILDGLIKISTSIFLYLIGIFPDQTASDIILIVKMRSALEGLKSLVATVNWIFPVDYLFLCILSIIGINIAIFLVKLTIRIATVLSGGVVK